MNCLKNILDLKDTSLCIEFCTKQIMIKKKKLKEIKKMSKEEIEIGKPYNVVKVVKKILDINKHSQEGKGIKILTPNQMLSRLPITLAQLKAGNNSDKLKNEIRQLLYSLYRSKNMTKQVYNNLIKHI